ncbi:MAG: hypothetical protein SF028_09765 [Candidatus Sumerlaeia bacterium]|nr:hypothetical protein [Candidatus Sumerlaeia bacterium]
MTSSLRFAAACAALGGFLLANGTAEAGKDRWSFSYGYDSHSGSSIGVGYSYRDGDNRFALGYSYSDWDYGYHGHHGYHRRPTYHHWPRVRVDYRYHWYPRHYDYCDPYPSHTVVYREPAPVYYVAQPYDSGYDRAAEEDARRYSAAQQQAARAAQPEVVSYRAYDPNYTPSAQELAPRGAARTTTSAPRRAYEQARPIASYTNSGGYSQPDYRQAASTQPVYNQPVGNRPEYAQVAYSEPAYAEPVYAAAPASRTRVNYSYRDGDSRVSFRYVSTPTAVRRAAPKPPRSVDYVRAQARRPAPSNTNQNRVWVPGGWTADGSGNAVWVSPRWEYR